MALSITIPGADFTYNVGSLTLPDRTALIGEFLFGGDEASTVKNRAGAFPDMTVIGAPVYGAASAEVRSGGGFGSVGFDTGIALTGDATVIGLVQKVTNFPPFLAATGFVGFANYSNTPALYNSNGGPLTVTADTTVPSHNDFAFFTGTMPTGGAGKLFTYNDGTLITDTAEVNGGARGTDTLKFGTTISSVGTGVLNVAYGAVFERILTDQEIAASYLSLKSFITRRGATVH